MAGAFQSGFAMGQGAYTQALAHAERAALQKREEERWAMQREGLQLQLDQARLEAKRQNDLQTVMGGIRDYTQGIDRQATNAALDADFEAADQAALSGQPLPPSHGGSAANHEAALTVKKATDPSTADYRLGLNRRLIDAAILNRDFNALRTLEGETRGLKQQGFLDEAARLPSDQVMAQASMLNTNQSQIPLLFTGKTANGYQFLTTDAKGNPAKTIELSEPQARQLVAAKLMADAGLGAESIALVSSVNKELADLITRSNTQTGQLVTSANDAQAKEQSFVLNRNADQRAAKRLQFDSEDRADAKAKQAAASLYYLEKNPTATPAELDAVKRGVIPVIPDAGKDQPAEVRLAAAYIRAGLAKDMAEGLRMATTLKTESPERVRADIFAKALAANMGNAQRAQEATDAAMRYLFPEQSKSNTSPGAKLQNVTAEDIAATAKKYGLSEDEVRRRLGL